MTFAIVLNDILSAVGLQHLLSTYFNVKSRCFETFDAFLDAHPEQYDGYFVSAEVLVASMEQLLPRRQRVVLVTDNNALQWNGITLSTLHPTDELVEHIDRCIQSVLYNNETGDVQGELTSREVEVLRCVAQGMLNKEIAEHLHISINTVLSHRKNIVAKLGIKTVSGLSLYAMMNGIIESR